MMGKKKRATGGMQDDGSSTDSSDEKSTKSSCTHIKKALDVQKLRKQLKANGLAMTCANCEKNVSAATSVAAATEEEDAANADFEYDSTLWLCLKCGTQLCGRNRREHALQHYKTPHSDLHALAMNTRTFEIWCYECENEVNASVAKSLLECVEIVKKAAQRPPPLVLCTQSMENKIVATYEAMRPLVPPMNVEAAEYELGQKPLPLPPPPSMTMPIPGMAKRVGDTNGSSIAGGSRGYLKYNALPTLHNKHAAAGRDEELPRVRGLTNLGNTCFFNAVLQCLAQTPYLLEVLKESSLPGEKFILPGGTFQSKDSADIVLPMIEGELSSWGSLTSTLANTLEELQSWGGVFTPSRLFDKLCAKCPQFRGGDQHDSHELLRHLLESVRAEDLKRYQRVILQNLGYKDQDINSVSAEMRLKCKLYGNQAGDRILRPEQVFRGFLVSTLTCQDCYNVNSRHEYFLDMSLPVSCEKTPPRRKSSPEPDNSIEDSLYAAPAGPTKAQLRKEKKEQKRQQRSAKKQKQKQLFETTGAGDDDSSLLSFGCPTQEEAEAQRSPNTTSSSEESDADVEDNLIDDNLSKKTSALRLADANGNNQTMLSPVNAEKRGDSPENAHKDSLDEDENDSGIATSPANAGSSFASASESNGTNNAAATDKDHSEFVLSAPTAKTRDLLRQVSKSHENGYAEKQQENLDAATLVENFGKLKLTGASEKKRNNTKAKRVRTQSHSDWSSTIAPRYQCEDGECSVQSCLNNFTGVELMTGNNKVGCDICTKMHNGNDPKAKTVNTNATKQFLISSPPAVLILHLKRFQLGPRCIFRKLTRGVSFPLVLDIAPFCGSKVKNLPNVNRKQKKLLYALYGVVEHSGGMYGGHYTAYVKVRAKLAADDKRRAFIPQGSKAELDQDDEQRKKLEELLAREKARELRNSAQDSDDLNSSSSTTNTSSSETEADDSPRSPEADAEAGAVGGDEEARDVQVPLGKWYYVSDSRVQDVNEDTVLRSQAYLLFYERIY